MIKGYFVVIISLIEYVFVGYRKILPPKCEKITFKFILVGDLAKALELIEWGSTACESLKMPF
ncbi:MAG: hypothetical protein COA42_12515 [Alteromonadaceae bacterium]|nr:MAG: hypothetical protein COA42_12515 [Alteromonadaceae bacterium]